MLGTFGGSDAPTRGRFLLAPSAARCSAPSRKTASACVELSLACSLTRKQARVQVGKKMQPRNGGTLIGSRVQHLSMSDAPGDVLGQAVAGSCKEAAAGTLVKLHRGFGGCGERGVKEEGEKHDVTLSPEKVSRRRSYRKSDLLGASKGQ